MKKIIVLIILTMIVIGGGIGYCIAAQYPASLPNFITTATFNNKYLIKRSGKVIDDAKTLEGALDKVQSLSRAVVINTYNNEWVYTSLQPYLIITDSAIHDFKSFEEAYSYAKRNDYDKIYYNNDEKPLWEANVSLNMAQPLKVPLIMQFPELPRGCEVTALAMLFEYRGQKISKMKLAEEVKKDPTPYKVDQSGRVYYGNPYDGFVGDMYNMANNGYAVYHGPIAELGTTYFGDKLIDLTGGSFEDVLYFVAQGNPMWVITNATYEPLSDEYFEIWHTPTGIVKTTKKLHAVLITGFDSNYIYINDSLYGKPNRAIKREGFQKAWEQMGNQAVTILK